MYHLSESEDEIAIDNVPLVTAHAVLESLRYLEFETAKVTGAERKRIYEYAKNILDTDNLYGIPAFGKMEKYRRLYLSADSGNANPEECEEIEYVFEDFSIVKDSLKAILTPELSIIGKSAVGGVGRAFIGAAGAAATESAKGGYEIDWNYLLLRLR